MMKSNKMTKKTVLFGCFGSFFVCLCVVAALTGVNRPTLAGTLGETVTSIGLSEEIDGASTPANAPKPKPRSEPRRAPTPEPNVVAPAAQQGPTKIEKVAQKLFQSLQSGVFDRSDFSPAWDAVVPKDANFSNGINALCKPLFDQFGKPENLGPCQMTGPNSAVFPLQCAKGALIMTVSLDPQEKIAEWRLLIPPASQTPVPPAMIPLPAALPPPAAQEAPPEANTIDIKDFNGFQREINRINIETRNEEEQWLGTMERKAELARAIDDLAAAQLRFLRKLAETEHAEQTVKAIDLVLKQRQDRLNKLTTKLQDELKDQRQQQATERRARTPRATGDRMQPDQTQPPAERPATRLQRRAREPNAVGQ
jgi:hypothetical protein